MCLLIKQPEGVSFSEEWLRDFFARNNDGFGYAYAENNTLYYNRMAGSVDQMLEMYKQVAGKSAILHWRMATAGKVHHDNSHPYAVLTGEDGYPLYLAHNGVLSCGNSFDTTMSDTYAYIHTFLRPILKENPELFKNPAFKRMVEAHIGANNKFALIDAFGHIEVYNAQAGVEWEANEGKPKAWMSNTYAWSAGRVGLGAAFSNRRAGSFYNQNGFDFDFEQPYAGYYRGASTTQVSSSPVSHKQWARDFATDFFKAVSGQYQRAWQKLQYQQMWDFAENVGKEECDAFLDAIKKDEFTADEIISYVESGLALVETVDTDKRLAVNEFFPLLTKKGYTAAYASLSVAEARMFLEDATDHDYVSLIDDIELGVATDTGITDAVRSYTREVV